MTLNNLLDEFLFTKKLAGLENGTVNNYHRTLILMIRYLGADLPLSNLTFKVVSDYIIDLYSKPISRATVSSYVRNVKIFFRWVATEYNLAFDPLKIKIPKSPKKIVHIYTDYEIRLIFKLVKTNLSGNAIRLFVSRLEYQLGFPLSSHKLRHNFATNFCINNVRKTGNSHVYDLSILMGHESIETTKRYEHFAHEIIAAENSISHLDDVLTVDP